MQITGYRATCISMLFAFVLNAWTVIIQTNKNDNHHLDVGSYLFNNSIVVFLIVHCSMMVFPAVSIKNLPVLKKNRIFWILGRWLELAFIWWLLKLLEFFSGRCLSTRTTKMYIYMPFHATCIMYYVSLIIFSWFLFKFEFDIDAMIQNKLFANQFKSLRRLELDAYNTACIAEIWQHWTMSLNSHWFTNGNTKMTFQKCHS